MPGGPCKCCVHPERKAIGKLIVEGLSSEKIAARYGMSHDSVRIHRKHIRIRLALAREGRSLQRELAKQRAVVEPILKNKKEMMRLYAVDRMLKMIEIEFGTRARLQVENLSTLSDAEIERRWEEAMKKGER